MYSERLMLEKILIGKNLMFGRVRKLGKVQKFEMVLMVERVLIFGMAQEQNWILFCQLSTKKVQNILKTLFMLDLDSQQNNFPQITLYAKVTTTQNHYQLFSSCHYYEMSTCIGLVHKSRIYNTVVCQTIIIKQFNLFF